ncbi:MAG TPA: TraB/GumN family protein, partial [Arenimonas sp.]|nr:TraB/GumN family protein [Arenimonas sp.]
ATLLTIGLHRPTVVQAQELEPTPTLQAVVVSGVLPGPGLWKVSRDGRSLWIIGSLTPVPKRMEWESLQVERTLTRSGQVLMMPGLKVDADVGFFGGLMLLPTALSARKIPDDKRLQDVLPPALYERWLTLKARYLGSNRSVERWRPMFAAQELYDAAIRKSGLSDDNPVVPLLRKRAKKHGVPMQSPRLEVKLTEPKAALKAFAKSPLDDTACFEKTLDRLETDLANMRARANAWAVGDIDGLRQLPFEDHGRTCLQALLDSQLAAEYELVDVPQRVGDLWLKSAEDALRDHETSLAVLPISQLLKPDGYLARLQARGYEVEAPASLAPESSATAPD